MKSPVTQGVSSGYDFTADWFNSIPRHNWEQIIPKMNPQKILEIGSYEGASACYLIQKLGNTCQIELHCIDTWDGGVEHQAGGVASTDMESVEKRFHHNTRLALSSVLHPAKLEVHKGPSDIHLPRLLSEGKRNYFDFIYIDGSHQASDVLFDAVLAHKLVRIGGCIAFDDYLWSENLPYGKDPLRCPKPAIDAFVNLNFRKVNVIQAPLYQLYVQKTAD